VTADRFAQPAVEVAAETVDFVDPSIAHEEPRVVGQVVDRHGWPVAGVAMTHSRTPSEDPLTRSDDYGNFELALPPAGSRIRALPPYWVVDSPVIGLDAPPTEVVVQVVETQALRGRVVDLQGQPIPYATVHLDWCEGLEAQVTRIVATPGLQLSQEYQGITDESGQFFWPAVPALRPALLRIERRGFEPVVTALSDVSEVVGDLVLAPTEPSTRVLAGQVVTMDGTPVADAEVSLGETRVRSDRQGNFSLEPPAEAAEDDPSASSFLHAWHADHGVCRKLLQDGRSELGSLVLQPFPDEIRGILRDAEGQPWQGCEVSLVRIRNGGLTDASADLPAFLRLRDRTQSDGCFRFRGFLRDDYALRVRELRSGRSFLWHRSVRAGDELTVISPNDSEARPWRGKLQDHAGRPIAGANLVLATRWQVDGRCLIDPFGSQVQEYPFPATRPESCRLPLTTPTR
jgi:hypothetical protein